MEQLVSKMIMFFSTPEQKIMKQGCADNYGMFFISRGDCVVNQLLNRKTHVGFKLLVEGDHFGEISLLYGCKRSCSVISRNYNTMAHLTYKGFFNIAYNFPLFKIKLLKSVYRYKDP